MRFEMLNWMDIEKYLEQDDRVMVVIGSCEQHGYLSNLTDVKIPLALADAASQKTGVLVAPPINFGVSPYFLNYPGTISLRLTTLLAIVEDIFNSLYSQGFRRFLFLNGHGGNIGVKAVLYELANQKPDAMISWYEWWHSHSVEVIAVEHNLKMYHASWLENFPFTRVSSLPEEEKVPPRREEIVDAEKARQIFQDGVFGGKYQVADDIMEQIFSAALNDVINMLRFAPI